MRRLVALSLACDAAALAVAGLLASLGLWPGDPAPGSALLLFGVSALVLCWGFRAYVPDAVVDPRRALALIPAATALASLVFVLPVPGPDVLTVVQMVELWLLSTAALLLGRLATARLADVHLTADRPTLIVGAGRVGRIVERRLRGEPRLGLNPVGFLDDDPLYEPGTGLGAPVLGGVNDLERVVREWRIGHVLIAFSKASDDELVKLVWQCERLGVSVAVVPRLFELTARPRGVQYLGGISLVGIRQSTPTHVRMAAKGIIDRVASAVLIVLFAPVLALASAAVLVTLGRPILFRQRRVGPDGRTFEMLKLRTMRDGPVIGDGPEEAYRCNRVGAFLRRASLDELPQLFNILKGEMSFIGPRPERPELVADFSRRIYRYDDRHRIKGGISGWAQVHGIGRGEDRFSDGTLSDRAEWDNFYIEHWSPLLDVRILMRTFSAMWRFRQGSSGSNAIDAQESPTDTGSGADGPGDLAPSPVQLPIGPGTAPDLAPAPAQFATESSPSLTDAPRTPVV